MVEFDRPAAPKYSIVIPTYNHFADCFKPCIDSVIVATKDMLISGEAEIVVVSNGSTDETVGYCQEFSVLNYNIRLVAVDEPLGYTVATNIGIRLARGEFVVLLNNDTTILDWGRDGVWLDLLRRPFDTDANVGVTGPKKIMSKETGRPFVIFFLAMIRRSLFQKFGHLDETFNPGGGEDIDFCMRLEKHGYKCVGVPTDGERAADYATSYPIYHIGEATVHSEVAGWEDKFWDRMKIVETRTKDFCYSTHADVTCEISTKGRYFTTLPLAIMSVINQTLKPKRLMIFMDDYNETKLDLRQHSIYKHLFNMLLDVGIMWDVVFGDGKGQVLNHQKAIDMSTTEFIWRMDDDNYAESDVLSKLMSKFKDDVGAVAGSVPTPNAKLNGPESSMLCNIQSSNNMQWTVGEGVISVDHLYSTFVFRRAAALHGYCTELSVVGHREETIFSYEMKLAGWNLFIDRSAVTWHLREDTGGIRSFSDTNLWNADEKIFQRKMSEWNVSSRKRRWINLDCGLGDHWVFKMILDDLKAKYTDDKLTIAACFNNVFEGDADIDIVSISDAKMQLGEEQFDRMNVYRFCVENNWTGSLKEAFIELYINGRIWI